MQTGAVQCIFPRVKGRYAASLATFLSFLVPGLGQAGLGLVRRGVLLFLPVLALIVVAWVVLRTLSAEAKVDLAFSPEFMIGLLIGNLAIAAYRIIVMIDARRSAIAVQQPRQPSHRGSAVLLAVLIVATVGLHGTVELVGYQAYTAMDEVFDKPPVADGEGGDWEIPDASFAPDDTPTPPATPSRAPGGSPTTAPTATPPPTPTPTPGPAWANDGRLNLLLIGSDSGPGRWSLRTDTMIVLSVDVESGRAAMFGVPRNMTGVPLPPESKAAFPNGRFPDLLNALYVYAMGHPRYFPGGDARGFRAVTGAVQQLVGVKLDGAVVVDLNGFVKLVDAVGGLWIDIPERVVDNHYPPENGGPKIRISFRPGCQKLNGHRALAYARTRHQDSDYGRMRRQQAVLLAIAHQTDPIGLLPEVPELLKIAGDHLWTTLKRDQIGALAALAARVDPGEVETTTFTPPNYPSHMTTAWIKRIRREVRGAFDGPAPKPKPSPTGTEEPIKSCRD